MAAREGRGRGVAPERSPEARRKPGKRRQLLSLRDGRSAPLGACPRQRGGTASRIRAVRGSRPTVGVARVPQGTGGYGGDGGADPRGPGTRDRRTGCEAREGRCESAARRGSREARVRSGAVLQARVGRLGFGFRRAARGHRDPRRGDADGTGGPGPDRTCEAGLPKEDPGFRLPWGGRRLAQAGCRWCRMRACTPASTVLARRQGALCPARTSADRKIAPDASSFLGIFWGSEGEVVPTAPSRRPPAPHRHVGA